jgi:hypothetical protein
MTILATKFKRNLRKLCLNIHLFWLTDFQILSFISEFENLEVLQFRSLFGEDEPKYAKDFVNMLGRVCPKVKKLQILRCFWPALRRFPLNGWLSRIPSLKKLSVCIDGRINCTTTKVLDQYFYENSKNTPLIRDPLLPSYDLQLNEGFYYNKYYDAIYMSRWSMDTSNTGLKLITVRLGIFLAEMREQYKDIIASMYKAILSNDIKFISTDYESRPLLKLIKFKGRNKRLTFVRMHYNRNFYRINNILTNVETLNSIQY